MFARSVDRRVLMAALLRSAGWACGTAVEPRNSGREAGPTRALVTRCQSNETPRPPIVVTPKTKPVRQVGPPPEPLPVQHSATFVLRQRTPQAGLSVSEPGAGNGSKAEPDDDLYSGNALQYLLRKADESLDEIEDNPPEAAKVMYEVSKGPVGTATAKGVELVGKVGYMAGKEAIKVLVPAAGKVAAWAVQQGAKAAMGAVQKSLQEGSSTSSSRRDAPKEESVKEKGQALKENGQA